MKAGTTRDCSVSRERIQQDPLDVDAETPEIPPHEDEELLHECC